MDNIYADILKMVIPATLAALLAYKLGAVKERKSRLYENNTKLLDEVLEPIMQIINNGIFPFEGYEGISEQQATKIMEIIDGHSNIVEERLITFSFGFKEEMWAAGDYGDHRYCLDTKGTFLTYIEQRRNKLRKSVNRPYTSNAVKARRSLKNGYRSLCRKLRRLFGRIFRRTRSIKAKK
jgi:hypothetical protein